MEVKKGGVCAPKGYKAAACEANIKYKDRDDMAVIISDAPCDYAGVFTQNVVKAAPVIWDRNILKEKNKVRMIIANSGIANAATGKEGYEICQETAKYCEEAFSVKDNEVLIASTGVIGFQMPMDRVKKGVDLLRGSEASSPEAAQKAARAIMTTDTVPKQVAVSVDIGGKEVTIGAMAKGSGMIHPNMCTMLCFITSDVNIDGSLLQTALKDVCADTFNMISVDGDTSTNDTCIVLANGLSENERITDEKSAEYKAFFDALYYVSKEMAMMLAGDGEGATALVEVRTEGLLDKESARILARSVITSSLTKAAIFGHDANWGRIMCALGYAGVEFDPEKLKITLEGKEENLVLVENGKATDYSEEVAGRLLGEKKVTIVCEFFSGDCFASAYGCDLSYDYVKINADYRS